MQKPTESKKKEKEEETEQKLALYRKYRPQKFEEVVGQEMAIQILKNSIQENKISHAYLFSGSLGTGKTTLARIFAKEIGCTAADICELDAASNNSVDNIRDLIEASNAATFGSKYKVYILDEAHMLSKSASNALLKTLEEPPAHVIFILATTDKHKLLDTVVSRCQEINFLSPDVIKLKNRLTFISEQEKVRIDDQSLELLAIYSQQSYRNAISLLEKIINSLENDDSKRKKITVENIKLVLGIIDKQEIINIIKAITEKNINLILEILNRLELNNKQKIEKFFIDFIKLFELSLLLRMNLNIASQKIYCATMNLNDLEIEELKFLSKTFPKIISSATLLHLLEIEKKLKESSLLKESCLIIGLIDLIEKLE